MLRADTPRVPLREVKGARLHCKHSSAMGRALLARLRSCLRSLPLVILQAFLTLWEGMWLEKHQHAVSERCLKFLC